MVKIERTSAAPASLAIEKAKQSGTYRGDDVMRQLKADFHGKCYLCEIDELQSVEIEHLKAHHNGADRDRMFDWNNLFYSCAHCNGVKNRAEYEETILDCCQVDPEEYLSQQLVDGHVQVKALQPEGEKTAQLVTECFERANTGIRVVECQTRVDALQKTMNALFRSLNSYRKRPTPRTLRALRGMLSRSYKFAGFTRAYVREHLEDYPQLEECVSLG